jgi:predicted nucleic acid-binding protein
VRAFLDTNVVVYAFDQAAPEKREKAIRILESGDRLVVSTQVLLESWWVLTRKLGVPLTESEAAEVIEQLCLLPVVATDSELVLRAIQTSTRAQLALWDALIVEAARTAGCEEILTEDLQHGQDFGGIVVVDPFR